MGAVASVTEETALPNDKIDAPNQIVMGGDFSYPPYEFINSKGTATGLNIELMSEVAKSMGLGFRVHLGLWQDQMKDFEAGKIDVLGMFYSEFRKQRFSFSAPFASVSHEIFVANGSQRISSLEELSGRTVLVQQDSFAYDYVLRKLPLAHFVPVSSESEALQLLATGKYDAALIGQAAGNYLKESLGISNVSSSSPPLLPIQYCFAVRRDRVELLAKINAGLIKVHSRGKYDELYWKWLGEGERNWVSRAFNYLLLSLAILITLLLLGLLWTWSLRRQVAHRTRERSELIARLNQALQAREQFISIASHELRTPLTPLRAQIQLVQLAVKRLKNGDLSQLDQLTKYTKDTDQQLDRLTRLVNNLLDIATIRAGRLLNLKTESCNLSDIIRDVLKRFESELQASAVAVQFDLRSNPRGDWDALRLEQVITNLLTNSLKYANKSGRIQIRVDQDEMFARMWFEDEGPGIAAEKLSKIFDPFEHAVSEHSTTGLGLGLFISQQIIQSHGGTIRAEPGAQSGTVFVMELPRDP